jgi:hypothetical protein
MDGFIVVTPWPALLALAAIAISETDWNSFSTLKPDKTRGVQSSRGKLGGFPAHAVFPITVFHLEND